MSLWLKPQVKHLHLPKGCSKDSLRRIPKIRKVKGRLKSRNSICSLINWDKMNNKGNISSLAKNVSLTNERILNECETLGTKEEKITYLKKVISDCQRIINFAETLDGKVLDVDLLKRT